MKTCLSHNFGWLGGQGFWESLSFVVLVNIYFVLILSHWLSFSRGIYPLLWRIRDVKLSKCFCSSTINCHSFLWNKCLGFICFIYLRQRDAFREAPQLFVRGTEALRPRELRGRAGRRLITATGIVRSSIELVGQNPTPFAIDLCASIYC